jgi:RNA polymerase sigma factor (sigma-70 family)
MGRGVSGFVAFGELRIFTGKMSTWEAHTDQTPTKAGRLGVGMPGRRRTLEDRLATPQQIASQHELEQQVENLIAKLTYRQRTVIKLRYGLNGTSEYDLQEISRIMVLDYETVKKLFGMGMRKLQGRLGHKLSQFL